MRSCHHDGPITVAGDDALTRCDDKGFLALASAVHVEDSSGLAGNERSAMEPDESTASAEPRVPDETKEADDPTWGGTKRCLVINTAAEAIKSVTVTHFKSSYEDPFSKDFMDPLEYAEFSIHVGSSHESSSDNDFWDVHAETLTDGGQVMILDHDWYRVDKEAFDSDFPIYLCIGPISSGFIINFPSGEVMELPYSNYGPSQSPARSLPGQQGHSKRNNLGSAGKGS